MILEGIKATGVVSFYDVSGKLLSSTNTVFPVKNKGADDVFTVVREITIN